MGNSGAIGGNSQVNRMSFEILSNKVRKAIEKRGFGSPTDIQEKGMPVIHSEKDTLIIAPTGLGKTESVMLPLFDKLIRAESEEGSCENGCEYSPISILYLTPLKSLNRDLLKRMLWWGQELGFDVSVRHGDTTQYERTMQAQNPPHVLICTPETLQAILIGSRMREHLSNVRHVVIDEIHELVDGKRGVQLSIGLERLKQLIHDKKIEKKEKPHKPQLIGISATIGSPEEVAKYLSPGKEVTIVNVVNLRTMKLIVESPVPTGKDKDLSSKVFMGPETTSRIRRVAEFMAEKKSVLAFTNTRESAEIMSSRLRVINPELRIETHHSSLSKNVRIEAEEEFREGRLNSLVCTSSLELGIDIGHIDFILQYMSPRQVAKLTQRVGRSGHTASGISDGVIIGSEAGDCFESAVIAKHALESKIEPTLVYGKSLDVLCHQIVGLSMDEYGIPYKKAFEIVKRAGPFMDLGDPEFFECCFLMQRLGYIWLNDLENPPEVGRPSHVSPLTQRKDIIIKRRKKAWEYYYQNLSTIPSTNNFQVFDVVSNQPVGTLDAEFMAMHGTPGTMFIVKGRSWKILEVLRNRIMVEPVGGLDAAIPAWAGELIPVPKDVSQDVGKMRREIAWNIETEKEKGEIIKEMVKKYPIDSNAAKKMYRLVESQYKFGFVPDHEKMLLEYQDVEGKLNIVIHSMHGSLINDTFGRAISILLSARFGSVGLQTDPYRIILKMQRGSVDDVMDTITNLDEKTMESIIKSTLHNTEVYRWRFLHVAQRLGIISRDADFGPGYLTKIIEAYKGLPPHEEAIHEVVEEKLDIMGTKELISRLRDGLLSIKVMPGLSPIGNAGLYHKYEIVAPKKPDLEIFKAFKERLMSTRIRLLCIHCGSAVTYGVNSLPKVLSCVNCHSKLLAVTTHRNMDAELLMNRRLKHPDTIFMPDEQTQLDKISKSASLVAASGQRGVIAQAGRGIGPRTASRILRRMEEGDEFLKEILKEEQLFARNKRFWRD